MGNSQDWVATDRSFSSERDLLANLLPIEDGESLNEMLSIGRFKIYRFRSEPYEIVMKHVRVFAPDNPKYALSADMAKKLVESLEHKNVAKLHCVNFCSRSNLCIQQVSIESYVNYYAINLEQVIDQRKATDTRFTSGELWYLLSSLIDLALALKKLEIYFGVFMARNVYLSPQGYLKVYLFHLTPNHKHLLYHHIIGSESRDLHKFLPIAPECLPFLKIKAQELVAVDIEKLDVFGVAMVALEAMLFNSPRRYYLTQDSQFALAYDERRFRNDFRELQQIYPTALTTLILKMSSPDPKQRLTFEEARSYISSIRDSISINGSVKMVEDQENPILPKLSYQSVNREQEYQNVLKSITHNCENRLEIVPVRPCSKDRSVGNSQYRSITTSAVGRKENKLQLSNATVANSMSRKRGERMGLDLPALKSAMR